MICEVCKEPGAHCCGGCQQVYYCSVDHQKAHWKTHKENCCLFVIKEDNDRGRYWVATRNLKAGTILLDEEPLFTIPNLQLRSGEDASLSRFICLTCGLRMTHERSNKCSTCNWPICSKKCEQAAIHAENECKTFAAQKIEFPPHSFTYHQITLCLGVLRGIGVKNQNPESYKKLMDLQHTRSIPYSAEDELIFQNFINRLRARTGLSETVEECNRLSMLILINAFDLMVEEAEYGMKFTRTLKYVYWKASKLRHCCSPNATWTIGPAPHYKIMIRTSTAISKGEELTVSYFPRHSEAGGTVNRLKGMLTAGFICQCLRCVDPTELDTFTSAVTCTACKKDDDDDVGYLLPIDPLNIDGTADWKCRRCQVTKVASSLLPDIDQIEAVIEEKEQVLEETGNFGVFETFCNALIKKYKNILHPNHWIFQKAARTMFKSQACRMDELNKREFERFIQRGIYILAIEDKVSPGYCSTRGTITLDLSFAHDRLGCMYVGPKCNKQRAAAHLKLCAKFKEESFKCHKNDIPSRGRELCQEARHILEDLEGMRLTLSDLHL